MTIRLNLNDFMETLDSAPGLVFGPSITTKHNTISELWAKCASIHGFGADTNFPSDLNMLRSQGTDITSILKSYSDQLNVLESTIELQYLAKVAWCLCISLTQDMLLEMAIRERLDATPSSRRLTIVDSRKVTIQGPSIPCYKLLGNYQNQEQDSTLAILESDIFLRQESWLHILSGYMEHPPSISISLPRG